MGLDRQLEELCSVYNERSDAELLSMHENRDDLTELAQDALAQVMRERRISVSGVPVSLSQTGFAPDALESPLSDDEVELQTFDDAFRLSEATRVLSVAEIAHRVVNWDEFDPQRSAMRGGMLQLGLVVGKADQAQARKLLQDEMKLFPPSEGDDYIPNDQDEFELLGIYVREDALKIAHALGSAGISFIWTDSREDSYLGEEKVRFEVYAKSLQRADTIVKQLLTEFRY